MNNNNIVTLERYAENFIDNSIEMAENGPTEEDIRKAVMTFKPLVSEATDREIELAISNLEKRYYISMDEGILLRNKDSYKKWYFNSIAENGTCYWDRYKRYLDTDVRMSPKVIEKIEYSADQIMDSLANPKSDISFKRKGLVIGAVQSGKTSNYIALMNKAADSGYKVIILLTGTIEKLRQQTQGRVDEGFIGSDSKAKQFGNKTITIGVGKYAQLDVSPFTTTSSDFKVSEALKIEGQKGPVVFVLKKNKSILEKLEGWLKKHNLNPLTGKIESPMLLIDDEADNASVNTSSEDKNPTAINQSIRNILNLFNQVSYVGFTATPFANIFIDPQLENKNGDDLFPRDFIYLLKQPSNYVGPDEIYREDGLYHFMIRNNDDFGEELPLQHKNGETIDKLPLSLENSIISFFLANAIRDVRGQNTKHRSMLIHVSRYISVQNNVRDHIKEFVNDLIAQIKNYILLDEENQVITQIHSIFEKEFNDEFYEALPKTISKNSNRVSWDDVKKMLYKSVRPIQVEVVNSGTAAKKINYDEYPEGLRIIAIGGLSLARGLTLEGLMTSYFYRNTKMYDTLMQMGRWFGYRDGYVDLCRLWISAESADWYAHIAQVTEELKIEINKMAAQNKKPIDFGLKVRSADDAPLIITARNKMRTADKMRLIRSLNGQMVETPLLSAERAKIKVNNSTISDWLIDNQKYDMRNYDDLHLNRPTLKGIPKKEIIDLVQQLELPKLNDIDDVIKIINDIDNVILETWDVVIASSERDDKVKFGPYSISPLTRSFDFFGSSEKFIRMSKSKKRLGATNFATGGLTKKEYEEIKESVNAQRKELGLNKSGNLKAASEYMYFNTGYARKPLLVIYPISLKKSEEGDKIIDEFVDGIDKLVTGIALGIPDIEGYKSITYEYFVNVVCQRELLGVSKDIDEDEDEDEDY
ncbi:Z1 domain-containing protein [Listeria monocytogenes]|nr:Z1 domain-containing protein [Listeria monocytogenes]EKZ1641212.1 Z1 domain-containing protein [Listeria monocytogenes]